MSKQITMYQVREFLGSSYSRQLGQKLRFRTEANAVAKRLRKQGRQIALSKLLVAA